ncbi:DUF3068 domain-containing protein [Rhodococcus sp. AD45-ID]|uniref:DUF3068 domain-containing protein n=1 Tax=Rhodococcus TaxID=1827 RepID=UPI0005D357CB|nr:MULTISPECIES: DUF3068 domain-containing protein [Rhodococcus]KJF23793.1 hypothetical protein SZ00_00711 [Rhodococcus sp. AD45]MCE4266494.1 DUF3068 domain-containing protein [Rhodococcus globerulus]PSR42175.1 DUF3068 domain-containing protein [Rhodococcus sp. AD45-ID]ROZ49917.1 DUF3068 domain-containing protein [Rhodococcus sp. WS3]
MAERSGSSRILPCILVGLGAFLLAIAVLIPTYMVGKLEKTPLDLEVTTIATGNGNVLNSAALLAGKAQVDKNVPIVAQRYVTTQEPSNADDITVQAGQTVIRTDKQGESGLLTATVDTVTLDRVSSMPTNDPVGTIQTSADQPAEEVSREGLQYKFPFNTEQQTYPYFDLNARANYDINFVEETEINGMKVYHFNQTIEPVDLSKVVNSPTNKLTLPADTWGVPGGTTPVTMTRWYTNVRDLWVEPKTGVVIKGQEQLHQYYGRNKNSVDVDVLNVTLPFDEETIEYQIQQAQDGMDTLNLVGRTVPIVAGVLGVIALIAGIFLGVRGGKGGTPAPAHGGGGQSPSGAGTPAPGEHDWTNDDTQVIPRPDLRKE